MLRNLLVQHRQMSQLNVNMNVQNNVILYKFERNAYFRNMKIFGIGQLFGWSILTLYTYKPSFWDIFYTDIKFKEYWFNHMFRLSTFLFSIFVGKNHLFLYIIKMYIYIKNRKNRFYLFWNWYIYFAGPLMYLFIYAMCARSIKYIVLNKGGKALSITTHHMRKKKSNIHLPVGMVRTICIVLNYKIN